jgi:hypothetical protein
MSAGSGASVAGQFDKIQLVQGRDRAREVGGEEQRAFQRGDEDEVAVRVVGRDFRPELGDARLDLLLGEVRLADAKLGGYRAKSSRNRWASRSMSRR